MSEIARKITVDTLIPIGLAITLAGGIFYLGVLSSQIGQNTRDINELKNWIQNSPTQYQFEVLQADITDIKTDIKDLKNSLTK